VLILIILGAGLLGIEWLKDIQVDPAAMLVMLTVMIPSYLFVAHHAGDARSGQPTRRRDERFSTHRPGFPALVHSIQPGTLLAGSHDRGGAVSVCYGRCVEQDGGERRESSGRQSTEILQRGCWMRKMLQKMIPPEVMAECRETARSVVDGDRPVSGWLLLSSSSSG